MAYPDTIENKLLEQANRLIDATVPNNDSTVTMRLSLLEAVSCYRSGFSLAEYRDATGYTEQYRWGDSLVEELSLAIKGSGIPYALALSALARVEGGEIETKRNGAVYTDFRLVRYLAESAMCTYEGGPVIDPSCGTSIILAACAEYVAEHEGDVEHFVSDFVYGVDLSALAIRGSLLALAVYLRKISELKQLVSHFACEDSLVLGGGIPNYFRLEAFSLVVGNPPWERVRPSRNEFARERGVVADYGSEIPALPNGYELHRDASRDRSHQLSLAYGLKGGMDLYRAFFNLSIAICSDGGTVALYLPAGLIRSKSLAPARKVAIDDFGSASMSVFMNHAKFFRIDSRFKFVLALLSGKGCSSHGKDVLFRYCTATDKAVTVTSELALANHLFNDESGALGAPEVKTDAEEAILRKIWQCGTRMAKHHVFGGIHPVRELDMTLDRHLFRKSDEVGDKSTPHPLIEGRMVSQYRCGCKEYLSGSGRSAKWGAVPMGSSTIAPQFYVLEEDLEPTQLARTNSARIGFCDIAGQTNERAMQAAFIPSGCACGNKVPTLLFDYTDTAMLWLGIANSFVFDWIVRRYITTTINFFILENLPFPNVNLEDGVSREIIASVRRIVELEDGDTGWAGDNLWYYAVERARIEACVLKAYGLESTDLETVLEDFPLVDQVNARVCGGMRPTIELARALVNGDDDALNSAKAACERGAMPYVPNEHMRSILK